MINQVGGGVMSHVTDCILPGWKKKQVCRACVCVFLYMLCSLDQTEFHLQSEDIVSGPQVCLREKTWF